MTPVDGRAIVAMFRPVLLRTKTSGSVCREPDDQACIERGWHLLPRRRGALSLTGRAATPGVIEFVGLPPQNGACGCRCLCRGPYHHSVGRKPSAHYQIDSTLSRQYSAASGFWAVAFRGFSSFLLDHALVDIGVGALAREVQGVETVVLPRAIQVVAH